MSKEEIVVLLKALVGLIDFHWYTTCVSVKHHKMLRAYVNAVVLMLQSCLVI